MHKNIKSKAVSVLPAGVRPATLTMEQAAEYLGLKLSFLKQNPTLIKYVRIGGKLKRFRIVDLDAFLEKNVKGVA